MAILNKNTKKIWSGLLISLVLMVLLFWKINNDPSILLRFVELQSYINNTTWPLFLLILLLAPMNWVIEALKWKRLTSKIQKIPFITALSSVLTGMSFALVSPGKVGDFAGRILYLKGSVRMRAVIATLIGSLAHIIVCFVMGTIGLGVVALYTFKSYFIILFCIALILSVTLLLLFFRIHIINISSSSRFKLIHKLLLALKILKRYNRADLKKILYYSVLKFCTYTIQFVLATYLFGENMHVGIAFFTSCAMFWLIMVIPSFFLADVLVRGYVANVLFIATGIAHNEMAILGGTYLIWLINWVIPSLGGAIILFIYRLLYKKVKKNIN